MTKYTILALGAIAAIGFSAPTVAQDFGGDFGDGVTGGEESQSGGQGQRSSRVRIDPYIEVSQIGVAELSPGDDVVTYTQIAAGVDASVTGRNNGGSVSLRYERNIGYDDDALDSDTLTGIARGYASVVPGALTIDNSRLGCRPLRGCSDQGPIPVLRQAARARARYEEASEVLLQPLRFVSSRGIGSVMSALAAAAGSAFIVSLQLRCPQYV